MDSSPSSSHLLLLLHLVVAFSISATPSHAAGRGHTLLAAPVTQQTHPTKTNINSSYATDQFLAPHNQARLEVGVTPLTWSEKLGSDASKLARYQRDRKACGFADMASSSYGANQAVANFAAGPAEVVASWVGEKKYYIHANNSCAAGHECGTYTQVVWRKTAEVGCAQAVCRSGASLSICLYYPHGNVQGETPY